MRVLVTGGAGFIGANLVWSLADEYEVGVVDDLSSGNSSNVHPATWFRKMDVLDEGFVDAVSEFAPDMIVHLAAQASVAASLMNPERDWAVNVDGTRRVARLAAELGVSKVISASSAAVYGETPEEDLPISETAQKSPMSPYGRSKLAAEEALAAELSATPVDFASFRFSNVYGPRQDWRGEGGVVAVFCAALAEGSAPTIFGTGRQTRDFVYVGDVVHAITCAMFSEARLRDGEPGGPAYNISAGTESSIETLMSLLRPVSGYTGALQYSAAREGDIGRSSLDPSKAVRVFQWDARVPLEKGLPLTYRWFQQNR